MKPRRHFLKFLLGLLAAPFARGLSQPRQTRVLIIVGPTEHPPGTHEVAAGGRLMKHCLETTNSVPGLKVDLFDQWPANEAILDEAATVVFIGDIFPPMRLPDSAAILAKLGAMMQRGCGIACIHYATGLRAQDVPPDGDHPLLHWMGGYFATKCPHHQSVARIFPEAKITPAAPEHAVWRGCREFTLNDEPYINNYFGKEGNKPSANVTVLATSLLPPEAPKQEPVSWCVERADSGRGFAVVMPHFYRNWKLDDLRRFIMNGIVWTAKRDVPESGVETILPDLATFSPAAVEPLPKKPAPPKEAGPAVVK